MLDIVSAIQEQGIKDALLEVEEKDMKRMLPKYIKIVKEICEDQKQLTGVASDDEELFDIIEEVVLDPKSLNQISLYLQFQRDYQNHFEKSQTKVFNQYLKRLEKLEELDYFEMKSKQWREMQENLIQQSRIICTTLSSSGQSKFQKLKDQVDVLVIDEACQSNELESLIPFQLDPKKVIMVGDPKQLP